MHVIIVLVVMLVIARIIGHYHIRIARFGLDQQLCTFSEIKQ